MTRRRPARVPDSFGSADAELAVTLDNLDGADHYADWITELMAPYLRGEILEIGAGHGTFTGRLARYGHVTATELSERAIPVLEDRYRDAPRVTVRHADAVAAVEAVAPVDAAVLVNVLEHIEDDVGTLAALHDGLRPGGHVLVYSPAFEALYSRFDAAVGHYRRYTRAGLAATIEAAGLEPREVRYVNAPGAVAWYVFATRLGQTPTAGWSTRLFDRAAVPVVRRVERRVRPPFGQSVLAVARRPLVANT